MLNYLTGDEARRGGLDLVVSLTADQAAALGTDAGGIAEAVDTVLVALAGLRMGRDPQTHGRGVSLKDRAHTGGRPWDEWVLLDVSSLLARLEGVQDAMIKQHAAHGGSYGQLAITLGVPRATAQTKRDAVGRREMSPAELWATGRRGRVEHPGCRVPENMRSWSTPWHGYLPVDITPPELHPSGYLADSVAEGWAEPAPSPDEVTDWTERHAGALVAYEFDDRRWPLNPVGRTGRTGRNLGKWGENQAADPIVVAGTGADRRVLLIQRGDIREWAIPGGMVDPGETAPAALVRELREETGVDLVAVEPLVLTRTYVADWRATDHAWVASTVALYQLPDEVPATAGDDAVAARWWPASDLDQLADAVTTAGGQLYAAHRPLLALALDQLATTVQR